MPPRVEAQIWQLPVTTLNPAKADMYMFMLEQEFPGPGKRGLRAANAERELAVASAEFETQRLEMAGAIRRAYVTLALARRDLLAAFDTGRALEQLVDLGADDVCDRQWIAGRRRQGAARGQPPAGAHRPARRRGADGCRAPEHPARTQA